MARDRFEERWRRTQDDRPVVVRGHPRMPGEALARALGLSMAPASDGAIMSGTLSGLEVHVVLRTNLTGWDVHVRVRGRSLPAGLAIVPQRSRIFAPGDVTIGDEEFDARVLVRGEPREVVAVLDAEARAVILELLGRSFRIENDEAVIEGSGGRGRKSEKLAADVRQAAALLARLSVTKKKPRDRLRRSMRTDPCARVRARCWELLSVHEPAVLDAEYRNAPKYPNDIYARLLLRRDPRHPLGLELAVRDTNASTAERARALHALARIAEPAHLLELADEVIGGGGELREAALEVLADVEGGEALYAKLGEGALLGVLEVGDKEQRLAAIAALGERGSNAAVDPLLELASAIFGRWSVKDAARRAIAAIERRTGRGRGHLSVTPGQGGELSVAKTSPRGAVAIVDDSAGALSPADDDD